MLYSIHTIRKYCKYSAGLLHDTYILMYSWNLFVLDFVRRFFVSCAQFFETYAMRTLMKSGCGWRKISHKSTCKKDSESTYYIQGGFPCFQRIHLQHISISLCLFFQFIFMAVIYYKARGERDYHGSANFHDSRGYKESLFFSR